jgi:hypothetical protein
MGNKHCHNHDDFEDDYIDSFSDPCGDPDPCSDRWYRERARDRRAKRQGAMIALIVAGVVAVAAVAFFLFAYGIVVFDDNGKPVVVAEDKEKRGPTDKVVINADKIVIDEKHDKKDKHD